MPETAFNYHAYLQSSAWRARRNRRLQMAQWRCEACQGRRDLEVHHLTYARIGREWDQDLRVLCHACHNAEHQYRMGQHPIGRVYLKLIRRAAAMGGAGLTTADLMEDVKRLCAQHHVPYDTERIANAIALIGLDYQPPASERLRLADGTRTTTVLPYGDRCQCAACVAAGVQDRRIRLDPYTGEWLHGDALARWYGGADAMGIANVEYGLKPEDLAAFVRAMAKAKAMRPSEDVRADEQAARERAWEMGIEL